LPADWRRQHRASPEGNFVPGLRPPLPRLMAAAGWETLPRARSAGALLTGSRGQTSSVAASIARLDEMCTGTSYGSLHGGLFGPQVRKQGHQAHHQAFKTPEDKKERERRERREKQKEEQLLLEDEPWRFVTSYSRTFVDHGPEARPAPSTKPDALSEIQKRMERSRLARAGATEEKKRDLSRARAAEELNRTGALPPALDIKLTAIQEPPKGQIKGNYVGGLPPSYWKSELRDRFGVGVFSQSIHSRYNQPVQVVDLAKHNKAPLGGSWGYVCPD